MMDIYLIKWYDAFSIDPWRSNIDLVKEPDNPLMIKSVGFLFRKTKKYISIVQNSGNHDMSCGMINIPRKCIIKMKKL